MAIRGRGSKLVSGRGRNPPEPSPVYVGVQNDQNKRQKLGIDDASKQKHNYTSDYEDTNEYYLSNNIEDAGDNHQATVTNNVKKCKGVSFGISNNLRQSSRGIRHGQGRGRIDLPESSQPCTGSALPPPYTSFSASDANNVKKGKGVSFGFSNNLRQSSGGIRNGQGRGFNDPSEPSQSCTSPAAPPPPHMSLSTEPSNYNGWRSVHSYGRVDKRQNHGLTKADEYNARKGATTNYGGWESAHTTFYGKNDWKKRQDQGVAVNDEYYAYDDGAYNDGAYSDGEDEDIQLIREKTNQQKSLRQQAVFTNNSTKGIGGFSRVSNNEKVSSPNGPPANEPTSMPSSGGSHAETDRRKIITVEAISNPRRFVPQSVTRDIISGVITRMPTPAEKWKDYNAEMKDELFKEFMGKYKFPSDYDRNMARTVWERTCLDRYPDHLKNARNSALRQVNSTNLLDTKGHGPKGMKTEVWDGLVDIWLKPEWRKKSDANRCNRAALPDAVLHTGGSICFIEHKKRMENELKHEVSYRDVYDRIHKNKDGEYISRRSKKFMESYDTAMLEKYGEDSSTHPKVDSLVWEEASGPNKKRRTLGGRSLDIRGSTSFADGIDPFEIPARTEEAIQKAVDKAMTSFVQTQLVPMLEPILSILSSMQQAQMQGGVSDGI